MATGSRKARTGLRSMGLALCLAVLSSGLVRATDPVSDGTRDGATGIGALHTGLILFVEYQDHVSPSLSPAELRVSGARTLAALLEADGHRVLTYPEIEPAMRRNGVRSGLDLPAGLLQELREDSSTGRLVVAQLIVYPDRGLLLARGMETDTGTLYWAGMSEAPLAPDFWSEPDRSADRWRSFVTELGRDLKTRWSAGPSESGGPTLVLLPTEPTGLAEQSALLASHAILEALLASRSYRIPDPALVRSALTSLGHDPNLLDPSGRAELTERFGSSALLAPEIISFEAGPRVGISLPDELAFDEEPSPISASRTPLYLQVLWIDCGTGQVKAAESEYLAPDNVIGLFGFTRRVPLARRFENGALQIVRKLQAAGGSI